jgi:hypothetical protein
MSGLYKSLYSTPWTARVVAFIGAAVALVRSWGFAQTQNSLMDEGEYLLKGFLFTSGQYMPFEPYGLWTNHMPFSFLIPGWIQQLFGPGVQTGRSYALVLVALVIAAVWILSRRMARQSGAWSEWLAGAAVWALALNTALLKMYSSTTSQILITALLVWTLVLVLGPERPNWALALGSGLSALMLLTRLNLAPVMPLVVLYVFWQHGRRAGWLALGSAAAVTLIGHAIFWPGILRMWAAWLPVSLTPFLAEFRPPAGLPFWNPSLDSASRVLSLLYGLRYHAVSVGGVLLLGLLWPRRKQWADESQFKAAVFLAAAYSVLFIAHAWASLGTHGQTNDALGSDYCVFCFPVYLSFFSVSGLVLLVIFLAAWPWQTAPWRGLVVAGAVLVLATGSGYGAFNELGPLMVRWRVPRLRTLITTGQWVAGDVPLWEFLQARYGIDFNTVKRLLPALAGLVIGMAVVALSALTARWSRQRWPNGPSFGMICLLLALAAALLLSPSPALGAGYSNYDCKGSVIASYEAAGAHLAALIPADQKIYWQGTDSSAPLVYLDHPQLLPGQINQDYTVRLSGDDDAHLRFGFWTPTLAEAWLHEADFALFLDRNLEDWSRAIVEDPALYTELEPTGLLADCDPGSSLRIFERVDQ